MKILLLALLLSGCATAKPHEDPTQAYIGKSIDSYIIAHRIPDKTYDLGDKKLYEWEHCINNGNYCKRLLAVTKNGIIEQLNQN